MGTTKSDTIQRLARLISILGTIALALAGCGSRSGYQNVPAPNANGFYKVGKPYQINGAWYYPAVNWNYDKTGIASWYGPDFNGNYTADGERFDMNALTAAHRTLPLPSIVEVTNLKNGRSVELRVNDRGPYVNNRIIDVSRRAAQLLGFENAGMAPVRVKLLPQRTLQAQLLAQRNGGPDAVAPEQIAAATPVTGVDAQTLAPPPGQPSVSPTDPGAQPTVSRLAQVRPPEVPPRPSTTGSKIYIQVGAFIHVANAKHLEAEVDRFGKANIDTARVNGVSIYRVRLGPIATTVEADRLLSNVINGGFPHARLAFD